MSPRTDFRRPLFYSSLVIVGLLIGVLGTLWRTYPEYTVPDRSMVETIRFGSGAAFPPVVLPETLATRGYVDALTLNEAFKTVSGFVTPSVVFVEVETAGRSFFRRNRGLAQSAGSGVIISEAGHVVTNYHVIEGAAEIRVTLSDKREYPATVLGEDPNTDLAVLKLENDAPVPAIDFGDSDALQVGEWVLAVGNPFRLTSTVTAGIVSALGRSVNIIEDSFGIESFIQTDAAINPGNSGGALVNLRGELVGIATAIATESGSYEGYGFAVPMRLVERVVRDLIEFGEVQRGYLGVDIWPVDAQRAAGLGLTTVQGVLLNNVFAGLAADQAGLRSGDVLLSVEGRPIYEPNELQSIIALYRPGEQLGVEVWRDGGRRFFAVELLGRDNPTTQRWFAQLDQSDEVQPEAEPEAESSPHGEIVEVPEWGIGLFEMTDRFQRLFDLEQGAYVAYVENGGPASIAGLPRNTVIVSVDGASVTSAEDVELALEAGDGAPLLEVVRRSGERAFFELRRP
ncbi:MAG: trypsin-like peptidase domain-containing protein [Rhodothermales bacterium]|nr:trypsin-like peptidase domain-containing protein [Rhodothermales bacterium]MBO6781060.1 trypsin-like peptidase domain-containing protein [Rhodothermales bacterium]